MKAFRLLALCMVSVAVMALNSCQKNVSVNDGNIHGKWKTVESSYEYYEDDKLIETGNYTYTTSYSVYSFEDDGIGQVIYVVDGEVGVDGFDWILSGTDLIISFESGGNIMVTIESMESSRMVWNFQENYDDGSYEINRLVLDRQ